MAGVSGAKLKFSAPQQLSLLTLVLGPLRTLQGWVFPLIIAAFLGRNDAGGFGGVALIGFVVLAAVVRQGLEVIRLRWWVTAGSFELRTGILQIETKSVPLERIQNVDLSEPLLPRLFGLCEVRIETAGSGGGELALRYISRADAESLRELLASRVPEELAVAAPTTLLATDTGELLIAGATSNRVGALVVLVGAAWGWVIDLGLDTDEVLGGVFDAAGGFSPALVAAVVLVVAVVVGWVASIAGTLLRYHGFVLTEHGADLRREHGLLTRTSGVIPIRRVQAVRVERPWIRRFVHRATIVADTAGSVAAATDTGSGVVAPIIGDDQVDRLVGRVLGIQGAFEADLARVSPLAIRRGFIRAALDLLILTVLVAAFGSALWVAVLVLGVPLAWWWAVARYRAIGYRVDETLVVARSGVLLRRTWLVPVSKVQSAAVRSSPFQRRLGLASLSIDTAGPGSHRITVIDLEVATAVALGAELSERSSAFGLVSDGV